MMGDEEESLVGVVVDNVVADSSTKERKYSIGNAGRC